MTLQLDVVIASHKLISSALAEMDTIDEDRARDILAILAGTVELLRVFGLTENTKDAISTAISAAYILGLRDRQPIPDAFADVLATPAATSASPQDGGGNEEE